MKFDPQDVRLGLESISQSQKIDLTEGSESEGSGGRIYVITIRCYCEASANKVRQILTYAQPCQTEPNPNYSEFKVYDRTAEWVLRYLCGSFLVRLKMDLEYFWLGKND